jgi:general secretion pathway protein M
MQLSGWMGRSVAVAILIGIGAAAWFMLAEPLIASFFEHRESIARSQEMLVKYKALVSTSKEIDLGLRKLHTAQQNEDRLLKGASTQLVGAMLQNRLKEIIDVNKGSLTSIQVLPVRDEEGFKRIPLAVTLTASVESLQKIVYMIEDESPYLFIENLELQSNRGMMEVSEEQGSPDLQIHFEVFGYMANTPS